MALPVKPGDVLGAKYRVEKVLGEGGMGVVVAATHLQLDQRVAIKFMLPEAFENSDALARFKREARLVVKLRSEHVAKVLDTGAFENGAPYIVMEYMDGVDLSEEIRRTGPVSPQVAAEYIVQACDAIAEAHSLGIVHRDLKPANLFLTQRADGTPLIKVLDFGISKATSPGDANLAMTKTTAVVGSPLYMSPEQMKSAKEVDLRTDIWSLGIILYELVGGRPPFAGDTIGELMASVLTDPARPLGLARLGLPPTFCALVDRCLLKDRNQRCQNVAEIARGLAPFCPPRVLPTVERISSVAANMAAPPSSQPLSLQARTASLSASSIPQPPSSQPAPSSPRRPIGMQTGGGWGGTLNAALPASARTQPERKRTWVLGVVICGLVVAVLGSIGGITLLELRSQPSVAKPEAALPQTPAATPTTTAESLPSSTLPAPPPTIAEPAAPVTAVADAPKAPSVATPHPQPLPVASPPAKTVAAPPPPRASSPPKPSPPKPSIFDTSN